MLRQDGTVDDIRVDVQVAGKSPAKIVPTVTASYRARRPEMEP